MGLPLSKIFVELHHAELRIDSALGMGTEGCRIKPGRADGTYWPAIAQ